MGFQREAAEAAYAKCGRDVQVCLEFSPAVHPAVVITFNHREQVSARGVNLMANASAIRGLKISAIDKAYGSGGSAPSLERAQRTKWGERIKPCRNK